METTVSEMNIYQKLAAIAAKMPVVDKTLTVDNGKKPYSAVAEKDVLAAVKPLEEKYHIFSFPVARRQTTRIVEKEYVTDGQNRKLNVILAGIEVTYRFVNTDNPQEYVDTIAFGAGMDTGDKAPGKAMTYADKYALMKMYKISTGDNNDPDSQASPDSGFLFELHPSETNPMLYGGATDFAEGAQQTNDRATMSMTGNEEPNPSTAEPELNMTLEEARAVVLEIGSMKGKTFGEMMAIKPSYVEFYAGDKFNNPEYPHYKKAAQILLAARG